MKEVTVYIAEDGKQFLKESECICYELSIAKNHNGYKFYEELVVLDNDPYFGICAAKKISDNEVLCLGDNLLETYNPYSKRIAKIINEPKYVDILEELIKDDMFVEFID